jgi:meiotically up-regulated gene 157 (Mug157) protein
MFRKCYPNTLETTVTMLDDGTAYVITGDIDLMWLRDSSAQVHQYLPLSKDKNIQQIIEGLIKRQLFFIPYDPYAASFRTKLRPEDDLGTYHVSMGRNLYVAMHNYELDSLCYHVFLSYKYWKSSGSIEIFNEEWFNVINLIIELMITEQRHEEKSKYRYPELTRNGIGPFSSYTGMTWSAFRPSDDPCKYSYLIPSNMFAVVILGYIQEIAKQIYKSNYLESIASKLQKEIDDGIHKHAVIQSKNFGKIYAYEVDGNGNYNLMDDANVPSLLSIPYIGYKSPHDPDQIIFQNTRNFILSKDNPFFYSGSFAKGIGSPHTRQGYIWHMSIIMEALTSNNSQEILDLIKTIEKTDGDTNFMHESFDPNNPSSYSRSWFAWANSLFSELVLNNLDLLSKKI